VKRRRSLGELKGRLLQAGKACVEVRKPKCQRKQQGGRVEEEDPWNRGWAKDGAAEEPARVAGASEAGREGTRRSEKVKVSEEALLTRSSKAKKTMNA